MNIYVSRWVGEWVNELNHVNNKSNGDFFLCPLSWLHVNIRVTGFARAFLFFAVVIKQTSLHGEQSGLAE